MDQNELQNRPEMVHPARMTQETCRMDQKQDLGHIPQTVNHAGTAHKRAIQCEDLPMRHAPFIPKQIIPASNRQKNVLPHEIETRPAPHSHAIEKLPCDRSTLWAFVFSLHKIGCHVYLQPHEYKLAESLTQIARRPTVRKSRAHPGTGKAHPPTRTASVPNRSNRNP